MPCLVQVLDGVLALWCCWLRDCCGVRKSACQFFCFQPELFETKKGKTLANFQDVKKNIDYFWFVYAASCDCFISFSAFGC
jgi:hypothetical protein